MMSGQSRLARIFKGQHEETEVLGVRKVLMGLVLSTLILIGSTWGLLMLLSLSGVYSLTASRILPYTSIMLLGSMASTVVAFVICVVISRYPKSVWLTMRIHTFAKRGTGEYFLSPEPVDQDFNTVIRRSLYGSLLVVGIALTVISFDMMVVVQTSDIVRVGTTVMIVSVIVLPITLMQLYYGPWILKDSGLFHLDDKDRSLSNVGDDLEDILEFFAGVDIFLVWLELTLNSGLEAPWLPVFVILVPLGPLFSIVMNFTLVFMLFKNRATVEMMEYLNRERNIPSIIGSAEYIRKRVLSLVDRETLSSVTEEIPVSSFSTLSAMEPEETAVPDPDDGPDVPDVPEVEEESARENDRVFRSERE
ncbi:MAG: hypothetical protein DRO87_12835 [Candidatus Thorarchaeota archaeon]|nr:MAG: hypothetical protein DRO87_12835 [Candidatus Thorarchaeota archaeon]RLI54610.1 MAG: hypothetical protein DRP09_12570 [Candidatus Thorarchaeota archaeon]